tara:strand:- start:887 stop:1555 length:669 start_codon:yes stop_codon:yes gene_type:complete
VIRTILYTLLRFSRLWAIILCCLSLSCSSYHLKKYSFDSILIKNSQDDDSAKCEIHVDYPRLILSNNQGVEQKINAKIRNKFLSNVDSYCDENPHIESNVNISYEAYKNSLGLLSIISHITISGEVSAVLIEGYNFDLKSGELLSKFDLISKDFHEEVNTILTRKLLSRPLYKLDDYFYSSELVISGDNAIFYLPKVGALGPYEEIVKLTELTSFINKKYLK